MINVRYKNKIVGQLNDQKDIYHTDRYLDKGHFFCIYQGFGISLKVLKLLEEIGVYKIIIHYHGEKEISYESHITHWKNKGILKDDETDPQFILAVKEMDVV